MSNRAHGVPRTKGGLTIYRPDGTITHVPRSKAARDAAAVVADYQMKGRQGRNM